MDFKLRCKKYYSVTKLLLLFNIEFICSQRVFPSFGVLEVVFYLIGSLTNGIANIPNMFN